MALPRHLDKIEVLAPPCLDGTVRAIVHTNGGQHFDAEVVDGEGHVLVRMQGYETVEFPDRPDPDALEPLRLGMA